MVCNWKVGHTKHYKQLLAKCAGSTNKARNSWQHKVQLPPFSSLEAEVPLSNFVDHEFIEAYISNDVEHLYHELDKECDNISCISECNQLIQLHSVIN